MKFITHTLFSAVFALTVCWSPEPSFAIAKTCWGLSQSNSHESSKSKISLPLNVKVPANQFLEDGSVGSLVDSSGQILLFRVIDGVPSPTYRAVGPISYSLSPIIAKSY